jgi:hypothetical protein
MKMALIIALCFGAAVTILSWLLIYPASPVQTSSSAVLNLISGLQIVPTIIAIILSGNIHGGSNGDIIYWILVFGQWSILGLVLSLLPLVVAGRIGRGK